VSRRTLALLICLGLLAAPAAARSAQKDLAVTPELEATVTKGLEYLAETQQVDGAWPGRYGQLSGIVGLAALSFLAHGEMPGEGPYGEVIDKAVAYIVDTQAPNGLLLGRSGGSAMYSHGFATLALAEVYGNTDNPKVGPALKKAVGLILSAQNATGGWRYNVGSTDADTTVSGAQMVALRAAAQAGIEVPLEAVRRGVGYYHDCYCAGGGFGYTGPSGTNATRSGIGLLVLSLSGAYHSDEAKTTADWCLANLPATWMQSHRYYTAYYNSQAMYQAGGKYWRMWNGTINPRIMDLQELDGSWRGGSAGPAGDTAMALLSLEINYNFLPIYQR
jgi:hypothetical protein